MHSGRFPALLVSLIHSDRLVSSNELTPFCCGAVREGIPHHTLGGMEKVLSISGCFSILNVSGAMNAWR